MISRTSLHLALDVVHRIGQGWWIVGAGMALSAAAGAIGGARLDLWWWMAIALSLCLALPHAAMNMREVQQVPATRVDAWRARVVLVAGALTLIWLAAAVSTRFDLAFASQVFFACALYVGALSGGVALVRTLDIPRPVTIGGAIVLIVWPLLGPMDGVRLWVSLLVGVPLTVLALTHVPAATARTARRKAAASGWVLDLAPPRMAGLPLLQFTEWIGRVMQMVALVGTVAVIGRYAGYSWLPFVGGLFGAAMPEARGEIGPIWMLFGGPATALAIRHDTRALRSLPMSAATIARQIVLARVLETTTAWLLLIGVSSFALGQWPTTLRPELLSATIGLTTLATALAMTITPGYVPSRPSLGRAAIVGAGGVLVLIIVKAFPATPALAASTVLFAAGPSLTLAAIALLTRTLRRESRLYRRPEPQA